MDFIRIKDLLSFKLPEIPCIISSKILPVQGKMIIYGPYGKGKSIMAYQIGVSIASGTRLWLFDVVPQPTLLIQAEMSVYEMQDRSNDFSKYTTIPDDFYLSILRPELKLNREDGKQWLTYILQQHPYLRVIIIDPLINCLAGKLNDDESMGRFRDNMNIITRDYNVAVIVVHHSRKTQLSSDGEPIDMGAEEMIGSTILPAWADTILGLRVIGTDIIQLNFNKTRSAKTRLDPLRLTLDRDKVLFRLS